jgi:hypothetical protein
LREGINQALPQDLKTNNGDKKYTKPLFIK